eukprot:Lithocolla_globosa_v1_NODE_1108_length_2864_cov_6.286935.p2 type:complete len:160 gc:universal NODE_1108_length_2864_cov_6.286935:1904-1425(-)
MQDCSRDVCTVETLLVDRSGREHSVSPLAAQVKVALQHEMPAHLDVLHVEMQGKLCELEMVCVESFPLALQKVDFHHCVTNHQFLGRRQKRCLLACIFKIFSTHLEIAPLCVVESHPSQKGGQLWRRLRAPHRCVQPQKQRKLAVFRMPELESHVLECT